MSTEKPKSKQQLSQERNVARGACRVCGACRACGRRHAVQATGCRAIVGLRVSKIHCPKHHSLALAAARRRKANQKAAARKREVSA